MSIKSLCFAVCTLVVGFWTLSASAVVLYSDDFNSVGDSANWTVNVAPAANAAQQGATFAFDYSAMGIPPAPGGGGDTFGLQLHANVPGSAAAPVTTRPVQVLSGLSVSPTGKNFGANYKAEFYAWSNFFGAPNASGLADNANSQGGTNNTLFAIGTSGTAPIVVGNTGAAAVANIDGIGFATTADGGIPNDYRVYPKSGTIVPSTTPNVYAAAPAGSATANQNTDAFYTAKFLPQTRPRFNNPSQQPNLAAMLPPLWLVRRKRAHLGLLGIKLR